MAENGMSVQSLSPGIRSGTQYAGLGNSHYLEANEIFSLKAVLEMLESCARAEDTHTALLAPGEKTCIWGTNCVLVCFGFKLLV